MPYSDQVKENSESMGKEGKKMVKESDFGRPGQKIDWGHFVSQKLHRNRLSVLPPHPLVGWVRGYPRERALCSMVGREAVMI